MGVHQCYLISYGIRLLFVPTILQLEKYHYIFHKYFGVSIPTSLGV